MFFLFIRFLPYLRIIRYTGKFTGKKFVFLVYLFLALLDAIRPIDKILKLYKKFKKGNGFKDEKAVTFLFFKNK